MAELELPELRCLVAWLLGCCMVSRAAAVLASHVRRVSWQSLGRVGLSFLSFFISYFSGIEKGIGIRSQREGESECGDRERERKREETERFGGVSVSVSGSDFPFGLRLLAIDELKAEG